ncbi:uncharacterized protein Pyn_16243 [Prunus yedoensis var. nudiflora]|uniref:Uncharacterized protein n=1 Tax=Prunus yedoensis var. nudiflora TaxID=2094558 RepID=A0A314YFW8_PRUYE|nr:uncharacterized protein Pyn_16243 [Prunus yedoensis var. nudiflora]
MISSRPDASMSRRVLAKKLGCAKKAWKSFTKKLQSKLHKLNIPKAVKTTTRHLRALRSKFHFLIPSKLRALTKASSTFPRDQFYNHHYEAFESHMGYALGRSSYRYHNKVVHNKNSAAIHIDELFAEPAAVYEDTKKNQHSGEQAETSKGKQVVEDNGDGKAVARDKKSLYSVEDAWQAVVAKSPQLRVVDERAEEFITKFRQDMKLQKEKSLREFQEMLARST